MESVQIVKFEGPRFFIVDDAKDLSQRRLDLRLANAAPIGIVCSVQMAFECSQ
jgi:hypothetical protein